MNRIARVGVLLAVGVALAAGEAPAAEQTIGSNLAAPDMLWDWSAIMPPFIESFLGPYLNVLPLVTVALFLVTQKMSPEPTHGTLEYLLTTRFNEVAVPRRLGLAFLETRFVTPGWAPGCSVAPASSDFSRSRP